jgi:hypothetical protein
MDTEHKQGCCTLCRSRCGTVNTTTGLTCQAVPLEDIVLDLLNERGPP